MIQSPVSIGTPDLSSGGGASSGAVTSQWLQSDRYLEQQQQVYLQQQQHQWNNSYDIGLQRPVNVAEQQQQIQQPSPGSPW